MYTPVNRGTYAPRDLGALRPPATTGAWRSVRRRQRRMYRAHPRPDPAVLNPGTLVAAVLVSPATVPSHLDATVQTEPPTPTHSSIAVQTSMRQHTSVATQTPTPLYTSTLAQTLPTTTFSNAPADDIWIDGPPHGPSSLWGILDDPLPPPPPIPPPPKGFIRMSIPVEWARRTNHQRPPAPRLEPACYSLAETTAQIIEVMSPEYPSVLHALVDYQHLPPFQRRALLELHRLLFPYGLDRVSFASRFTLLPMTPIFFYLQSWQSIMSMFVQDCSAPEDLNYNFSNGIFSRY
ncbi:hypothetical protein M407DRAFT_31875 [Tulasnella calospora MUT 4182]|uniref:Uncharacterized protein n=1 Tax=Tulasnella calospora MUT 4182 TaxID=1051891 RepID=A0A0C3PUB2_9AGAM|nr:hypothetical protein M407DRAFT_31875 [Tulasnella calospora MUT 4182]